MNTIQKSMHTKYLGLLFLSIMIIVSSCDEEDPFVDRTVAPVLIVFDDIPGYLAGGGLTTTPSVTKKVTALNYNEDVTLSASFYELDKSGILDHTIGIDSIPVAGMVIKFSKRDGTAPLEYTTNDQGKILVSTTWEALGITDIETIMESTESKSVTIPLSWKGTHMGQSFTRFSQLLFQKDPG